MNARYAIPLALGLFATPLLAQSGSALSVLTFDPPVPKAGQEVRITVAIDGEPPSMCGLVVHFDDGTESRQFKMSGDNKFPFTLGKVFAKPGSFSIKAEGRKVANHFPCVGAVEKRLIVEAPPPVTAPAGQAGMSGMAAMVTPSAAPACPEGYTLKGKPGKAGDFTCTAGKGAKKPEKVLDCGDTLEYFQTKTTLGCRKVK